MKSLKYLCLLLAISPLNAYSQSKAELQHEKLLSSTKYLTVKFSQTIYKKLRNRSSTRKGIAYFAKPNKFRWNYVTKPSLTKAYFITLQTSFQKPP